MHELRDEAQLTPADVLSCPHSSACSSRAAHDLQVLEVVPAVHQVLQPFQATCLQEIMTLFMNGP